MIFNIYLKKMTKNQIKTVPILDLSLEEIKI